MTAFAYCPACSWPTADTYRGPSASRLSRISKKRSAEWFLIYRCCKHSEARLPTAPRTEAMLATDAAKWEMDRWTGDADPLGVKRKQIEEREAKERAILDSQ